MATQAKIRSIHTVGEPADVGLAEAQDALHRISRWADILSRSGNRYHNRSRVESIYATLKTRFGNHLSSKKRCMQRRVTPQSHSLNIGRVNLHAIKKTIHTQRL
ncbi:MAG: hypothetical protein ACE5NN_06575 [Candidatus Bathyarchaeia archaeon]